MKHYIKPLVPYLLGWALLLSTVQFHSVALYNGIAQLLLFAFVVCIPAWRSSRLSYVDVGWPWGLVLIGVFAFTFGDGYDLRKYLVSAVYLFIGLRMGTGAIRMLRLGYFTQEFPRYKYQRLRWEQEGVGNHRLKIQAEILVQGLANASFLALPAFLMSMNPNPALAPLEIVGLCLWLGAFAMETVADKQKLAFLRAMKAQGERNRVCNVGLWRYSRHPNYFSEWMVWNSLIVMAIPSWLALQPELHVLVWALLGVSLVAVSGFMYYCLVHYTGAVPAEYFSAQKRPEYREYQQTTNQFFPGPVRKPS